jgi:hypothetical protein
LTTSSAEPGVSASTAPWWASVEKSCSVSGPTLTALNVVVTSTPLGRGAPATDAAASSLPQFEQNRLPGGFSVPQEVQNTRFALRGGQARCVTALVDLVVGRSNGQREPVATGTRWDDPPVGGTGCATPWCVARPFGMPPAEG